MILILSDDISQNVGHTLYEYLKNNAIESRYISVSNLKISTCYNCGYCQSKEYRKCVLKDDMQSLLYEIARCTHLILVSPLSFGSYSSKIKKLFDRMAVIADIHYYVVNKELVKGMVTPQKGLWSIGVKDSCPTEEKNLFTHLVTENTQIMNLVGKGFVVEENPNTNTFNHIMEVITHA